MSKQIKFRGLANIPGVCFPAATEIVSSGELPYEAYLRYFETYKKLGKRQDLGKSVFWEATLPVLREVGVKRRADIQLIDPPNGTEFRQMLTKLVFLKNRVIVTCQKNGPPMGHALAVTTYEEEIVLAGVNPYKPTEYGGSLSRFYEQYMSNKRGNLMVLPPER